MMEESKNKLKKYSVLIASAIFSIIIGSIGGRIIKDDIWIGLSWILIAFLIVYFSSYFTQIKANEDSIKGIDNKIKEINQYIEIQGKLLNTIKEIVILKKIYNKK